MGDSPNRTDRLSGPTSTSLNTGMLETAVSSTGTTTVSSILAFKDGSSQQGKARRASVDSNCVVAM